MEATSQCHQAVCGDSGDVIISKARFQSPTLHRECPDVCRGEVAVITLQSICLNVHSTNVADPQLN